MNDTNDAVRIGVNGFRRHASGKPMQLLLYEQNHLLMVIHLIWLFDIDIKIC